mmetsp:Transcript_31291/g.72977  ORF Transcript_31291/g.72977 Transcript_31291/m.72977 type:complete len:562 (-) Transcript_31291:199-1884(-)
MALDNEAGQLRLGSGAGTCSRNMASVIAVTEEMVGRCFYYPFRCKEEVDTFFSTFPKRMWSRIVFSSRHGYTTGEIYAKGAPWTLAAIRRAAHVLSDACLHGKVFVQKDKIGLESLHFTSELTGYVSYQDESCSGWQLDDGSPLPSHKSFSETRYDAEGRNFKGIINWTPSSFRGWRKYEYDLTFDEAFQYVVNGTVCKMDPQDMREKGLARRGTSFIQEITAPPSFDVGTDLSPPPSPENGRSTKGVLRQRIHSQSLLVFRRWQMPADAPAQDQDASGSSSSFGSVPSRHSPEKLCSVPFLSLGGSSDETFNTCPLSQSSAVIITAEGPSCSCYPYRTLAEAKECFDRVSWKLCSRILYLSDEGCITEEICSGGPGFRHEMIRSAAGQLRAKSLAGKVFVQDGQLGRQSIHFLTDMEAYVSFEHDSDSSPYCFDDGSPLPLRIPFDSTCFSASSRTFRGCVRFRSTSQFQQAVRWECECIFDDDFKEIVGGTVCHIAADGSANRIDEFGPSEDTTGMRNEQSMDDTVILRYRRWWQPALEVAFNFDRLVSSPKSPEPFTF